MAIIAGFLFYLIIALAILASIIFGLTKLFTIEDLKKAAIAVAVFILLAVVALSPVASRADCDVYQRAVVIVQR